MPKKYSPLRAQRRHVKKQWKRVQFTYNQRLAAGKLTEAQNAEYLETIRSLHDKLKYLTLQIMQQEFFL